MWNKGKNPTNTRHLWNTEAGWMLRETSAGELVLWMEIEGNDLPEGVEVIQKHPTSGPIIRDSRNG